MEVDWGLVRKEGMSKTWVRKRGKGGKRRRKERGKEGETRQGKRGGISYGKGEDKKGKIWKKRENRGKEGKKWLWNGKKKENQ